MQTKNKIQPDWWSKSLLGAILGLTLATLLSGIFAWVGYGGIDAPSKSQFNMWIIPPIWLLILSFSFLFQSGKTAFFWLFGSNVIALLILTWVKH